MAPQMRRTDADPGARLDAIEHPLQQRDARALAALMTEVGAEAPAMWCQVVGWGSYRDTYASGHSGGCRRIGFAPGKQRLSLFGLRDPPESKALPAKLDMAKTGVGCVDVTKLADVDAAKLRRLVEAAWAHPHG